MTAALSPIRRLPTSRRDWSRLMSAISVRPSKGMGQNFLVERGVVERIVKTAGVTAGDTVLEVGPGLGILTSQLLATGATVIAIELDRELAAHLRVTFGDLSNLRLVEGDALAVAIDELIPPGTTYAVVANLPYSVGSAVIMRLLELPNQPARMTVMVQHEVAERFIAKPPAMTVLSVAMQLLAKPRIAFTVHPGNFMPPPKVDSAVVILEPIGERLLARSRRPLFFRLVNGGFRHKRKQVANSIAMELALLKDEVNARLVRAGVDPMRRAETLAVEEWLSVLNVWEDEATTS
jgi:16S rRNA (adenine1518-N6/adenine1519-N6)-dimethyltransferase